MVKPSRRPTSFQTGSADRFTLPDLIRPYWCVPCLHRQCGSDLADNGGLLGEQQWGLRGGGDLQPVMHAYAGCLRLLIKLETAEKRRKIQV